MDPAQLEAQYATDQHPVDILEPEEEQAIHKAKIRMLLVLSHAITWILRAERVEVGLWQVVYALGLNQASRPITDVAADLGVEKATISRGAVKFCKAVDIPPSPAMKSELARESYSRSRSANLSEHEHDRNDSHQPVSG